MAQTEMRIRLIKGEKIVGEKYICKLSTAKLLVLKEEYEEFTFAFRYKPDDILNIYRRINGEWTFITDIQYDSFELGIKVGESWWFRGDRGKYLTYGEFTLNWRYGCFCIDFDTLHNIILSINALGRAEKIGNIHEEVKDGKKKQD